MSSRPLIFKANLMESVVVGKKEIADVLLWLQLKSGKAQIGDNLRRCYEALVAATIFPSAELELVELWLENLRLAGNKQGSVRQEHV